MLIFLEVQFWVKICFIRPWIGQHMPYSTFLHKNKLILTKKNVHTFTARKHLLEHDCLLGKKKYMLVHSSVIFYSLWAILTWFWQLAWTRNAYLIICFQVLFCCPQFQFQLIFSRISRCSSRNWKALEASITKLSRPSTLLLSDAGHSVRIWYTVLFAMNEISFLSYLVYFRKHLKTLFYEPILNYNRDLMSAVSVLEWNQHF